MRAVPGAGLRRGPLLLRGMIPDKGAACARCVQAHHEEAIPMMQNLFIELVAHKRTERARSGLLPECVGGVLAVAVALSLALAVFSLMGCVGGNMLEPEPPVSVDQSQFVGDALLAEAADSLVPDAECAAEGHLIMASEYHGEILTVYALTSTGGYGFLNGNFVKVSGTGVIPAVFTFSIPEESDAEPSLLSITYPLDGDLYADSVREMIPSGYVSRALNPTEEDAGLLCDQEQAYARAYLEEIDREAQVGEYGDFPTALLTDLGVSVEVSNKVLELQGNLLEGWPLGVGTCEHIVDGTRYVYEMAYERGDDFITFTRTAYDTGEVVERIYVDAATGDVMME